MTKHDELILFRNFYSQLPDGYLRDILADMDAYVERLMSVDLTCGVREILTEKIKLQQEIKALLEEQAALERKIAALQNHLAKCRKVVDELRRSAALLSV
jgi:cell division protein FtsB